jgi:Flp pilus assembly protein TadG
MLRNITAPARRFLAAEGGVAAVEMAFMAPVALGVLSVAVAGGQALTLYHKTVRAAHVVTDMVSRSPYQPDSNTANAEQLASTDLDTDLTLSQLIFYPFDTTNIRVVMTEIQVNANTNTGTIVWSEGYNGATALSCGGTITLDPAYAASGATYLLYGQVSYSYQPLGGILTLPAMNLSSSELLTIRNAPQITVPGVQTQC